MAQTKKKTAKKPDCIHVIGRRKTATARVRLYQKKGKIIVNNLPIDQYFPGITAQKLYLEPLNLTNTQDRLSFTIKVQGSGKSSQLGAVIHGLSRALVNLDEENKQTLKKRGFLTRDSRMKESRKVGTGGKARRKKQSPKR